MTEDEDEIKSKIKCLQDEFIAETIGLDDTKFCFNEAQLAQYTNKSNYQVIKFNWGFFKTYQYELGITECKNLLCNSLDVKVRAFVLDKLNKHYQKKISKLLYQKIIIDRELIKHNQIESMCGTQLEIKNFLDSLKAQYACPDYDLWFKSNFNLANDLEILNTLLHQLFSSESIVKGVFEVYENLFQVKIIQVTETHPDYNLFYTHENISKWHIQIYNIYDQEVRIGTFYLDLYKRDLKPPHPCIIPYNADKISQSYPVASVSLTIDEPYTPFYLEDITSLFHEMAHMFHFVFAGTNAFAKFPYDFMEIPSTLFENFIQSQEILKLLTKYPEQITNSFVALIKKCLFNVSFLENQISWKKAWVDYQLHTEPENKILDIINSNAYLLANLHSFNCRMDGYRYLYAREKSTEIYAKFFKTNELSQSHGLKFRKEFLSVNLDKPLKIYNDFINNIKL